MVIICIKSGKNSTAERKVKAKTNRRKITDYIQVEKGGQCIRNKIIFHLKILYGRVFEKKDVG